ncbi:hypothetical protein V2J09_002125 [Rumex salicifolius]
MNKTEENFSIRPLVECADNHFMSKFLTTNFSQCLVKTTTFDSKADGCVFSHPSLSTLQRLHIKLGKAENSNGVDAESESEYKE